MFGTNLNSVLGLGVSVFLKDEFTRNAQKVANSFATLDSSIQKKIKNQLNQIQLLGAGVAVAGYGVGRGIQQAVKETALFQESFYKTSAVVGGTESQLANLRKEFQALSIEMAYKFPYAANEISLAFLELSKAGIAEKNIKGMTEAVLAFATAADIGIGGEEGATNMLISMMNAYGIKMDQAMMMSDMISKAANISVVNPSQIYESLKYSQDILRTYNVSYAESIALLATMAQSGLKDSRAGIALGNMFNFINQATGAMATKGDKMAWSILGIDPSSVRNMLDEGASIVDVLTLMKSKMKGLASSDMEVLMQLWGVRGGRGAGGLMPFLNEDALKGTASKSFANMLAQIKGGSAGSAMDIVNVRMGSPEQKLQMWNKAWFDFKVAFVEGILPVVIPIVYALGKALKAFADVLKTPILGKVIIWTAVIAGLVVTIAGAAAAVMASLALLRLAGKQSKLMGMGGIVTIFQMLWRNLHGQFSRFNAAGRLVNSSGKYIALWSTGLKGLIPKIGTLIGSLGFWGKAIAAITITIYGIYQYSDKVKTFLSDAGTWVWNIFKTIGAGIGYLFNLATAFNPNSPMTAALAKAILRKDYENIWNPGQGVNTVAAPKEYTPTIRFKNREGKTDEMMEKLLSAQTRPINITIQTPDGKQTFKKYVDNTQAMDLYHNLGIKV